MNRARFVQGDLPADILEDFRNRRELGVDCEMMGLNPMRDRLCLVQIAAEDGPCAIVQIDESNPPAGLKEIIESQDIIKIFHYARTDFAFLKGRINFQVNNVFCTKIASRLARTYTDRHGLREVVREFTGETLEKTMTSSDWGKSQLSQDQLLYAQNDVIFLFAIKRTLEEMLDREGRRHLYNAAIGYLPSLVEMDLLGYDDIFVH